MSSRRICLESQSCIKPAKSVAESD
jgi:hypothetical protein